MAQLILPVCYWVLTALEPTAFRPVANKGKQKAAIAAFLVTFRLLLSAIRYPVAYQNQRVSQSHR